VQRWGRTQGKAKRVSGEKKKPLFYGRKGIFRGVGGMSKKRKELMSQKKGVRGLASVYKELKRVHGRTTNNSGWGWRD